jgi:hypothetical protein
LPPVRSGKKGFVSSVMLKKLQRRRAGDYWLNKFVRLACGGACTARGAAYAVRAWLVRRCGLWGECRARQLPPASPASPIQSLQ